MATISKKISPTDYEIIGDTQGILIPQGVRYTRFRPSNILSVSPGTGYPITPTAAQVAAGGGEDWNSGGNKFYVPAAGIYTVGFPCFGSGVAGSIFTYTFSSYNSAGALQDRRWKVMSNGTATVNIWEPIDLSLFVPDGGYFDMSIYCNSAFDSLLFDSDAGVGIFLVYLNEQKVPYMIVNKGALVSDNAIGKGEINDDGTLSISGELGTGTDGSKVSINRPDKWTPGIEYEFGDGLYGIRITGAFTVNKNTQIIVELTPFVVNGIVSYGGWWNLGEGSKMAMQSATPGQAYVSWLYERTDDHHICFGTYTTFDRNLNNGKFDVWVTYSK
jgi:hypothetical protein